MIMINQGGGPAQIKCIFSYSAPLELVVSLHVLAEPDHHLDCCDWARRKYKALSEKLREEIRFFHEKYGSWLFIMDLVTEISDELSLDDCTVAEVVKRLRSLEKERFAYLFLGLSAFRFEEKLLQQWIEDPTLVTEEGLGPQAAFLTVENTVHFLENMETMRERVIWVMEQYWEESFQFEWPTMRLYVEAVMRRERLTFDRSNPIEYIEGLHDGIKVEAGRLIFQKDPDYSIAVGDIRTLVVLFSVFSEPHLFGNIVGSKVNVNVNLNFHAVKLNEAVPKEMFALLQAVSDESRIKIMKVLWNSDATTKELADLLDLTPSTISLHLKILKEAGLVETSKVKKFVYYKLIKDSFYSLQGELIGYLEY